MRNPFPREFWTEIEWFKAFKTGFYMRAEGRKPTSGKDKAQQSANVGILKIEGLLMQKEEACNDEICSTEKAGKDLQRMFDDPNIDRIALLVDSGGGAANAPRYLTDVMQKKTKPIWVLIDNFGASAAYNISTFADALYCTHELSLVGSIGTMLILEDDSKARQEEGIEIIEIYAEKSTKKNDAHRAFKESRDTSLFLKKVNTINEHFLTTVKTNRPQINEEALTGAVFFAKDAKKMGLIDGILSQEQFFDKLMRNKFTDFIAQRLLNIDLESVKNSQKDLETSQNEFTQAKQKIQELEQELAEFKEGTTEMLKEKASLESKLFASNSEKDALALEKSKLIAKMEAYQKENPPKHSAPNVKSLTDEEVVNQRILTSEANIRIQEQIKNY